MLYVILFFSKCAFSDVRQPTFSKLSITPTRLQPLWKFCCAGFLKMLVIMLAQKWAVIGQCESKRFQIFHVVFPRHV